MKLTEVVVLTNLDVDSLHYLSHPQLHPLGRKLTSRAAFDFLLEPPPLQVSPPIVEIHGTLRHITCLSCQSLYLRDQFQRELEFLNPAWTEVLHENQMRGGLQPSAKEENRLMTNPDGDIDLPNAPYTEFRYTPCPKCLAEGGVEVDRDGAHLPGLRGVFDTPRPNAKGILKPSIVFFGESIQEGPRNIVRQLVQECDRILVIGSSLATYSAWRVVKEVANNSKGVGIINLGGVRGEKEFFEERKGSYLRLEFPAADVLGATVEMFEKTKQSM